MDKPTSSGSKAGKMLKLLIKIAVSVLCLWYVSRKIDFPAAGTALREAAHGWLVLALFAFILSKVFSSIRLNLYFRDIGLRLSETNNLRLYWLGMFYNLFLPGSISGDAYKVILLSKRYQLPYKKTSAAVLLDRLSGLLGLGLILMIYAGLVLRPLWMAFVVAAGALLAVATLYFIIHKWLPDFKRSFLPTLLWGIVVQGMQVICVYFILKALHLHGHQQAYVFLFLVSSMVAVLPLTIGGLGIREVVFLEGATYLSLAAEQAVLISLIFYLITLFTSAWGLIYIFREPIRNELK